MTVGSWTITGIGMFVCMTSFGNY